MTDVERELLAGLGYLLVQGNYLDDALVALYWIVSNKTETDLILAVRGRTLGSLRKLVFDAYGARITDAALLTQFDALVPVVDAAIEVRNEFMHSSYVFASTALKQTRRPKIGPAVEKIRTLRHDEIDAAIDVVGKAHEAVLELYDVTVEHVPDSEVHPRGGGVAPDGTYTPGGVRAIPSR